MRRSGTWLFADTGTRLDEIDVSLLRALHEDARTPNAKLAEVVGLSPSATVQRVRRLEEIGAIKRYVAEADQGLFQAWSLLFIKVVLTQTGSGRRAEFETRLSETREIIEATELAGKPDYVLKAALPSTFHWPRLLKELDPDGIFLASTQVVPAVRTVKLPAPHPLLFAE